MGAPSSGTILERGDKQYYQVTVGSGQNLIVTLNVPGNQYYYLYVKLGSLPTTTNYDAKSDVFGGGLDQAVTINNTQAGTYYIMVYANNHSSAYSGTYTITASTTVTPLTMGAPSSGTILERGDKQYYQVTVGSGQNLIVTLNVPANQYYYLYVKLGSLPTTTNYDAKSDVFGGGLDQAVTINNTQAGTYYIMVYANNHSSAYSGTYTITASQ
jgi:hypothetical protein